MDFCLAHLSVVLTWIPQWYGGGLALNVLSNKYIRRVFPDGSPDQYVLPIHHFLDLLEASQWINEEYMGVESLNPADYWSHEVRLISLVPPPPGYTLQVNYRRFLFVSLIKNEQVKLKWLLQLDSHVSPHSSWCLQLLKLQPALTVGCL